MGVKVWGDPNRWQMTFFTVQTKPFKLPPIKIDTGSLFRMNTFADCISCVMYDIGGFCIFTHDRDCITVVDAVDNENNVDVDVVAVAEAVNGDAEFVVLGTTVIKLLALVPRPAFGGFRIDEVGTEIEQNDSVKKISKFYLPF